MKHQIAVRNLGYPDVVVQPYRLTLRILDVSLWGLRLTILASRVPRRPLVSVNLWRGQPRAFVRVWKWEAESGH